MLTFTLKHQMIKTHHSQQMMNMKKFLLKKMLKKKKKNMKIHIQIIFLRFLKSRSLKSLNQFFQLIQMLPSKKAQTSQWPNKILQLEILEIKVFKLISGNLKPIQMHSLSWLKVITTELSASLFKPNLMKYQVQETFKTQLHFTGSTTTSWSKPQNQKLVTGQTIMTYCF